MDYGMGRFEINLEWCLTRFAIFFPGVGLVVMGISILVKEEIGRRPSEGAPIAGSPATLVAVVALAGGLFCLSRAIREIMRKPRLESEASLEES